MKIKKHQQSTSDYVNCALSAYVYYNPNWQPVLPSGWSEFMRSDDPSTKNYFGAVYINNATETAIFAHRGTIITNIMDWWENLEILLGKGPKEYEKYAYDFTVIAENAMRQKGMGNYTVSHTGHSLGACIAEMCAARNGTQCVTFESPGSREAIQSFISQGKMPHDALQNADKYTRTYNTGNNGVNGAKQHVGKILRVYPPYITDRGKDLPNLSYSLEPLYYYKSYTADNQHPIKSIYEQFNPNTGMPRVYSEIDRTKWDEITYTNYDANPHYWYGLIHNFWVAHGSQGSFDDFLYSQFSGALPLLYHNPVVETQPGIEIISDSTNSTIWGTTMRQDTVQVAGATTQIYGYGQNEYHFPNSRRLKDYTDIYSRKLTAGGDKELSGGWVYLDGKLVAGVAQTVAKTGNNKFTLISDKKTYTLQRLVFNKQPSTQINNQKQNLLMTWDNPQIGINFNDYQGGEYAIILKHPFHYFDIEVDDIGISPYVSTAALQNNNMVYAYTQVSNDKQTLKDNTKLMYYAIITNSKNQQIKKILISCTIDFSDVLEETGNIANIATTTLENGNFVVVYNKFRDDSGDSEYGFAIQIFTPDGNLAVAEKQICPFLYQFDDLPFLFCPIVSVFKGIGFVAGWADKFVILDKSGKALTKIITVPIGERGAGDGARDSISILPLSGNKLLATGEAKGKLAGFIYSSDGKLLRSFPIGFYKDPVPEEAEMWYLHSAAMLSDSDHIVFTWTCAIGANDYPVRRGVSFGRLFTNDGQPIGDEFLIGSGVDVINQKVTALKSNFFVVSWVCFAKSQYEVYGQLFHSTLTKDNQPTPIGKEFLFDKTSGPSLDQFSFSATNLDSISSIKGDVVLTGSVDYNNRWPPDEVSGNRNSLFPLKINSQLFESAALPLPGPHQFAQQNQPTNSQHFISTQECFPLIDGSLSCSAESFHIRVFPKMDSQAVMLRGMTPPGITGDIYMPRSCRPLDFQERSSIVCDGKTTTMVYTPHTTTAESIIANSTSHIGLVAITCHVIGKGVKWACSLRNGKSEQPEYVPKDKFISITNKYAKTLDRLNKEIKNEMKKLDDFSLTAPTSLHEIIKIERERLASMKWALQDHRGILEELKKDGRITQTDSQELELDIEHLVNEHAEDKQCRIAFYDETKLKQPNQAKTCKRSIRIIDSQQNFGTLPFFTGATTLRQRHAGLPTNYIDKHGVNSLDKM